MRSYDDILEHVIEDPDEEMPEHVLHELSLVAPRLEELRDFSNVFEEHLGQRLDPSLFWGLMGLMLTVS